jgi:hypothetical protein
MRLIDADALKKEFCKDIMGGLNWESIIDNAPTVKLTETEIQEVLNKRCMTAVANDFLIALQLKHLHGRWDEIREPFGWDDILSARCSVCGESYPYPEDTGFNDIIEMFKYCPNCGAKMEAGDRWKEEET